MSDKKLVVITGASSGFGEALARSLSAKGHPLLLLARRVERLQAMELPNCLCRHVDVTDLEAFQNAVNEAEAEFGPTDCLVNNAGVMLLSTIEDQDPAEWKTMLDVNVLGVLNGIKTVIKGMVERQSGTVINISSVAGRKTFPNHAAYCGTKFAVHALTENVREENSKHNIRFVTIAPGAAETELLSHTSNAEIKSGYEDWKKDMGGVLSAQDVANSIMYAYEQPQNVCIREIVICATKQEP